VLVEYVLYYTATCVSDYRRGFGLVNRFIDHLEVVTTNNYNTIADFHTTNHSSLSILSIFTGLYLVTALNNGCSSVVLSLDVSW
jgi:hypothetical protein